ncbi:MAG: hypothetical protein AB9835_00430 [Eubacteriales bacterium]
MADKTSGCNTNAVNNCGFNSTVCIDCDKILDSCRDRDCLEDLRLFLTDCGQEVVDSASSVRAKSCEILWTHITVDPIPFNRGFYQIDIRFFFKCVLDVCLCMGKSQEVEGIAVHDKKVILFGSEGNVNIFKSDPSSNNFCCLPNFDKDRANNNLPTAVVEVVDPLILQAKLVDKCHHHGCCCCGVDSIPDNVSSCVRGQLVDTQSDKICLVTLGIFSVIRIVRPSQIIVPANEFTIPDKECLSNDEDVCEIFKRMRFPDSEFNPPSLWAIEQAEALTDSNPRNDRKGCNCK